MHYHLQQGKSRLKKIYLATLAAAVTAAIVGGIILTQFNGASAGNAAATLSQNHQGKTSPSITQNSKAGNDGGNNFGPPDDGGYGDSDQLLG